MLGLRRGTVRLIKSDPHWARSFKREAAKLRKVFGSFALDIQHIGSSSIPHVVAKPIIDIGVVVPSLKRVVRFETKLRTIGYIRKKNDDRPERLFFTKGPESRRTHYVHIGEEGERYIEDMVIFRDYLRLNPHVAKEYSTLKQRLAAQYAEDRATYTKRKKKFVRSIVRNVRKDR